MSSRHMDQAYESVKAELWRCQKEYSYKSPELLVLDLLSELKEQLMPLAEAMKWRLKEGNAN